MILAAIDIGSNAARLLICEVVIKGKETEFNRLNIVRIPLQLGFDVFEKGFIGSRKKKMLIDTIKAYKQLMKVYEVDHYMACATSAMRDAQNSKEIIKEIEAETSIEIEIISGELEAEIIYENHIAELLDKEHSYLYMDVGGGSTELTLYHNNELVLQKSVNIGTVRLLTNKVKEETWDELKDIETELRYLKTNIIKCKNNNSNSDLILLKQHQLTVSVVVIYSMKYYYFVKHLALYLTYPLTRLFL